MSDLTHIFKVGQKVKCRISTISYDGIITKNYDGTVTEIYADHIIVNVPGISDHCYFENGFNMDHVYPEYNF